MIPTVDYIKQRYDQFNELLFENRLPDVSIELSNASSFLGKACYKPVEDAYGVRVGNKDFVLRISTKHDHPQDFVDDVIIHEMIHIYIAYHNIYDTSVHGPVFRSIMRQINEQHNRHIELSHHGDDDKETKTGKQYLICITDLNGHEHGITVCNPSRAYHIMRFLPRRYRFKSMKWYLSDDPFFNRYPKSITAKIYKIDEKLYSQHIHGATELTFDGKNFIPKP